MTRKVLSTTLSLAIALVASINVSQVFSFQNNNPIPAPIPLDSNKPQKLDRDLFLNAVYKNDLRTVKAGLQQGLNANLVSPKGHTCLSMATIGGHHQMIELLLDFGADVDQKSRNVTALMYAAAQNKFECARSLLNAGADTEATTAAQKVALHYATAQGHEKMVQLLLQFGANVDATDRDGNSALLTAAQKGNKNVVSMLLKHGANKSLKNKSRQTAYQIAKSSNPTIAKLLASDRQTTTDSQNRKMVGDAKQLAAALNSANDGDVLQLKPGSYDGVLVLSGKNVSIIGSTDNKTTLKNNNGKKQFVILARDGAKLTINNIEFEFSGSKQTGVWAIDSQISLNNCTFNNSTSHGCYGKNSDIQLTNCRFENFGSIGVFVHGKSKKIVARRCHFKNGTRSALQVESGASLEATNCKFDHIKTVGTIALGAPNVRITGCQFQNCDRGISAGRNSQNVFVNGCQFEQTRIAIYARDVTSLAQLRRNTVKKVDAKGQSIYLQNANRAIVADNLFDSGKTGFSLVGTFNHPVAINRNRMLGASSGQVWVKAQSKTNKNNTVARFSHNVVASSTAYGVVVDSSSPTVFSANTILSAADTALSLQRNSQAVLNGNCIASKTWAINFFETDANKSYLIDEQIYGRASRPGRALQKFQSTQRHCAVTSLAANNKSFQKLLDAVLNNIPQAISQSSKFNDSVSALNQHLSKSRLNANQLLAVTLNIEDMTGRRRSSEFIIYNSASAAAGSQYYVASDLVDAEKLLEILKDPNSPLGHCSSLAKSETETTLSSSEPAEIVLAELNRLIDNPSLFERKRFEPVLTAVLCKHYEKHRVDPKQIERVRRRNRELLDRAFPKLLVSAKAIAFSANGSAFLNPGAYWIVSKANRNLIQNISIKTDRDADRVIKHANAVWLEVQPTYDGKKNFWDLFQLRKPEQMRAEIAGIRQPGNWLTGCYDIDYTLRSTATDEQIKRAHQLATKTLPLVLMTSDEAEKIDPTFKGVKFMDSRLYVRRILAIVGTPKDAQVIAEHLPKIKSAPWIHHWVKVIAAIESRHGNLENGLLAKLAKEKNRNIAVVAATRLHLNGITEFDQVLWDYLNDPKDVQLATAAAYTLFDDDNPKTLNAMKSFHNHLLLMQDKKQKGWYPNLAIPTSIYLLAYGNANEVRFASLTPFASQHLFYLSALVADPLQPAGHLIKAHRIDDARQLAVGFMNRIGGDSLYHTLNARIIAHEKSRYNNRMHKQWIAFRTDQENELYASFYRPSAMTSKVIGEFAPVFAKLDARADIYPTLQSKMIWYPGRKHLNNYVKNWLAKYDTYRDKFCYFTIEEIEQAIKANGGKKPAAFELFRAAHAICTHVGIDRQNCFPVGMDRRSYIFYQPKNAKGYRGGLNGVIELRVETTGGKTRFLIRQKQRGYYHDMGSLASTIDGHNKPEHWPVYKYIRGGGRKLIETIQVRQRDKKIEVRDTGKIEDGFLVFEADLKTPANSEGYLDLNLNFFDQKTTMTFPLHTGENARRLRTKN